MFEGLELNFNAVNEPKYNQISRAIENYLTVNNVPPHTRLPSERQLSNLFGVTCVTVHRSLNELVQRKILVRKVGSGTYTADRRLHLKIGIVCHEPVDVSDYYIGKVLTTFHQYWEGRADFISLVRSPEDYEASIREYNLSGILVLSLQEEFAPKIRQLRDSGFPIVTIGVVLPLLADISFGTDHQAICCQAIEYLAKHGCCRIGMISVESQKTSVLERERGYNRAMYDAKLPVNPDWIIRKKDMYEPLTAELLSDILKRPDLPDAFLVASHWDFVAVYDLIKQFGLRIPEDISVIGFDDPEYACHLKPALTVFAQPIAEFTRQAAINLEEMIFNQPLSKKKSSKAILIERSSCV